MRAVTQKIVEDIDAKLRAIGAQYKIILPDGTALGELTVVDTTPKKRTYLYPKGAAYKIYNPKIASLQIGDVATFTPDEYAPFEAKHFQTCVQSGMINRFGNGSQTTMIDQATGNIETIRIR